VPEVLVISKIVWDGLSPEDQALFREAAKESVATQRKLWEEKEVASKAAVEALGAKINTVDKTPFIEAMKPVYDKYVTDPKLKDLVERIQATEG
jgi:TRAP-type C4-dicarboxylate transport system substrate-binding protein